MTNAPNPNTINQLTFDAVARHLMMQRQKSMHLSAGNSVFCMYRSPSGLRCAIGALMPDELYDPEIEGIGLNVDEFSTDARVMACVDPLYRSADGALLARLQSCHDSIHPDQWALDLRGIAVEFGLSAHAVPA